MIKFLKTIFNRKFWNDFSEYYSSDKLADKLDNFSKVINTPSHLNSMISIGESHGWKVIDWQSNIGLLSFEKDKMRINVYITKMTVGVCLNHPKQGKTQLYRKNVSMKLLNTIFENPRVHTGKGYKKK